MKRDEKGRFVRTTPDYKVMYEVEHTKYLSEKNFSRELQRVIDNLNIMRCHDQLKIDFLLNSCPFWVRWMFRKQFEKGK